MKSYMKPNGRVMACWSCAGDGWGPMHVLIPGPVKEQTRWGPLYDRDKDRTLCGIKPTKMWERDVVGTNPGRIECKRCQAMLKKQKQLDRFTRLIPRDLRERLPGLYENEGVEDPIVQAKWFGGGWTWYATEGEQQGDDWMFFGVVFGLEEELGYFTFSQLNSWRDHFGCGIQLDQHFKPKPLSEVWDQWPFK